MVLRPHPPCTAADPGKFICKFAHHHSALVRPWPMHCEVSRVIELILWEVALLLLRIWVEKETSRGGLRCIPEIDLSNGTPGPPYKVIESVLLQSVPENHNMSSKFAAGF